LPDGFTLARLLAEHRGKRNPLDLPLLSVAQILRWCDDYYALHEKWPLKTAGAIRESSGETWAAVDSALSFGRRGLPGDSSLARFLARQRGKRNHMRLPHLSIDRILKLADAWAARHGRWPTKNSGEIPEAPGETWAHLAEALNVGGRGLRTKSSLAQLLAEHRGVRNVKALPPFTERRILTWARAHRKRTGDWPSERSGPVLDAPGETWRAIQQALNLARRGLPGGTTIAKLLGARPKMRRHKAYMTPTLDQILRWADDHFARTGVWPTLKSGAVFEIPGETWGAIDAMLRQEGRNWRGRTSLSRLLRKHRGVTRPTPRPRWTVDDVLAWSDAFHSRTGKWPTIESGAVETAGGKSWRAIDGALQHGYHGLPGGSSLARLLAARRGKRNNRDRPRLRTRQIVAWADDFRRRHGRPPMSTSGPIEAAPGENWSAIDASLKVGSRGLPGGSSLAKLLARYGRRSYYP
jgi:hypothetical protein